MSRKHVAFYIAVVAVLCFGELLLHWLLARSQESFLFAFYSTRDSGNKYFMAGTIDFIIPAAIVGGTFAWKSWPQVKLNAVLVAAFVGTTIIATMRVVYKLVFGSGPFTEIWGPSAFLFTPSSFFLVVTTFLPAFFFAQCMYVVRRDLNRLPLSKRFGRE